MRTCNVTTQVSLTTHFEALRLDVLNHLNRRLLDVGHILAMAVFPQEAGRADDNVQAIDTSLDGELGITHVTANIFGGGVSKGPMGWTAEIGDSRVRILAYCERVSRRGMCLGKKENVIP